MKKQAGRYVIFREHEDRLACDPRNALWVYLTYEFVSRGSQSTAQEQCERAVDEAMTAAHACYRDDVRRLGELTTRERQSHILRDVPFALRKLATATRRTASVAHAPELDATWTSRQEQPESGMSVSSHVHTLPPDSSSISSAAIATASRTCNDSSSMANRLPCVSTPNRAMMGQCDRTSDLPSTVLFLNKSYKDTDNEDDVCRGSDSNVARGTYCDSSASTGGDEGQAVETYATGGVSGKRAAAVVRMPDKPSRASFVVRESSASSQAKRSCVDARETPRRWLSRVHSYTHGHSREDPQRTTNIRHTWPASVSASSMPTELALPASAHRMHVCAQDWPPSCSAHLRVKLCVDIVASRKMLTENPVQSKPYELGQHMYDYVARQYDDVIVHTCVGISDTKVRLTCRDVLFPFSITSGASSTGRTSCSRASRYSQRQNCAVQRTRTRAKGSESFSSSSPSPSAADATCSSALSRPYERTELHACRSDQKSIDALSAGPGSHRTMSGASMRGQAASSACPHRADKCNERWKSDSVDVRHQMSTIRKRTSEPFPSCQSGKPSARMAYNRLPCVMQDSIDQYRMIICFHPQ